MTRLVNGPEKNVATTASMRPVTRPTTLATLQRLVATLFKHLPGMTWKNVVSRRE